MKKLTKTNFIDRSKKIHNEFYEYKNVIFINTTTLVSIKCPIHGEFKQTPKIHLNGGGCPTCGRDKTIKSTKKNTEYFIQESIKIHGYKYNYEKSIYQGAQKNLIIICKEHGEFLQMPNSHIQGKSGCPTCGGTKKKDTEQFIKSAKEIHDDRYDYSEVDYVHAHYKIKIICKEHGPFIQKPTAHLAHMSGCPKCAHNNVPSLEEFIEKARKFHGNTYDYSLSNYEHSKSKLIIICKKHGEFKQSPNLHIRGNGCPKCRRSKGEIRIATFLENNNIKFEEQKRFKDCKIKKPLAFDFYLTEHNICIEFNGLQHYKPHKFFGGDKMFEYQKIRDKTKRIYCKEKGIHLINISGNIDLSLILKMISQSI